MAGSPAIRAGNLGTVTSDNRFTLAVDDITSLAIGDKLKIGAEIVTVTDIAAGSGTTGTLVTRAVDGTSQDKISSH